MTLSPNAKEHIKSALITFATGFLITIAPMLNTLTVSKLDTAFVVGIALAGIRGGLKLFIEWAISQLKTEA